MTSCPYPKWCLLGPLHETLPPLYNLQNFGINFFPSYQYVYILSYLFNCCCSPKIQEQITGMLIVPKLEGGVQFIEFFPLSFRGKDYCLHNKFFDFFFSRSLIPQTLIIASLCFSNSCYEWRFQIMHLDGANATHVYSSQHQASAPCKFPILLTHVCRQLDLL